MATLPIHPRQHAYQAGRSTESALHQLVGRIERALDAKEYALGVFFDIEGVFDNTTLVSIKTVFVLDEWKVHRSARNWMVALIQQRKICVRTVNVDINVSTNRGLLSPTLWSMIADSLLKWLSKQGVYSQGHTDDGVVLVIGIVLPTECEIMQHTLKGIEKWCFNHQLSVNLSKTQMVLFTRKYKIEMMKNINSYQQELTCSKQVKYLGVILDSKLNWKVHVDAKCQKALVAFYQLRRVTGKTWGYSPKIVHWIYTMVIRPMLSYAAVVWWPRVNFSTVENNWNMYNG